VAEGTDCAPPPGGVSTPEEAVPGTTPVGSRILFSVVSGNVTDDVVAKYIAEQNTNVDWSYVSFHAAGLADKWRIGVAKPTCRE
jgi:hypothetical protein